MIMHKNGNGNENTLPNLNHKKIKELKALAGSIAHEVRNPISAILMIVDLMKQELKNNSSISDSIHQYIKLIEVSSKEAIHIISITLNNLKEGKIDSTFFQEYSVEACIKKSLETFPFKGKEKQTIKVQIDKDFLFYGSDILLQNVIFNLLTNALYCLREKPSTKIFLQVTTEKYQNKIYVKDTGTGISQKDIKKLFKNSMHSSKIEGTGIGLFFCKKVMKSFNGDITCKSVFNEYTEFTLSFPHLKSSLY